MKHSSRALAATAICLAACGGDRPTAPLPPVASVTVTVDTQQPRQTVEDVSAGNFVHYFPQVRTAFEPSSSLDLDRLQPRHARVRMGLEDWEPQPGTFDDSGFNRATFEAMQELQRRGIEITASVWDVPDWMVANPNAESQRTIPASMYGAVADAMAAWLVQARDVYGVSVAYVSFNEANYGVNVKLSSAEHAALITAVGRRFDAARLPARFLAGDCTSMGPCAEYTAPILADAEARPYLGVYAFHSWDIGTSDAALEALGQVAAASGLPIRCTEGGWDAQLWQRPGEFPGWGNALNLATIYSRVLKLTRASVIHYWQMMDGDYALNDGVAPYPSLQVIALLRDALPAGSRVVSTSPNAGGVYSVAVVAPRQLSVVLIAPGVDPVDVHLSGVPDGSFQHVRSSATETRATVGTVTAAGGALTVRLSPRSVNVLTAAL